MGKRYLQLAAVFLYLAAAIAGTVYTVEVLIGLHGAAETLTIGAALLILCGPVVYWLLRLPTIGGRFERNLQRERQAVAERQRLDREAAIAHRVSQLRTDPVRAVFIPLVQSGRLLTDAEIDAKLRRIAELEAVPHRKKYAAKVLAGAEYTDAQIDYLEIPGKLMLCEHLQPVEAALKESGIPIYYDRGTTVEVDAILNWVDIRDPFHLPAQVVYEQIDGPDNHYHYNGLHCTVCNSRLNERGPGGLWPARTPERRISQ